MDKSSLAGIILAVGGIVAGLLLEGGNLRQILQPTAAIIVFGGTLGAVMLQFPLPVVLQAFRRLGSVFINPTQSPQETVERLVMFTQKARRDGIVSLDADLAQVDDTFLRKSLMLAVDGTEPQELRRIMELVLDNQAEYEEQVPQVFESAGGFAPTVGIINPRQSLRPLCANAVVRASSRYLLLPMKLQMGVYRAAASIRGTGKE